MAKIELDNMTPEQELVVNILIHEGYLRAYEEIIADLEKDHYATALEDPYYAYYIKFMLDKFRNHYNKMIAEVTEND